MLNKKITTLALFLIVPTLLTGCSNENTENQVDKSSVSTNTSKTEKPSSLKEYSYFKRDESLTPTQKRYLDDFEKEIKDMATKYSNGEVVGDRGFLTNLHGSSVGILDDEHAKKVIKETNIEVVDVFYKEKQDDGNYFGPTALLKIKYPAMVDTAFKLATSDYIKNNTSVSADEEIKLGDRDALVRWFESSNDKVYHEEYVYVYSTRDYGYNLQIDYSRDVDSALSGQLYNYDGELRIGYSSSDTLNSSIEKALKAQLEALSSMNTEKYKELDKSDHVRDLESLVENDDFKKILEYMASNSDVKVLSSFKDHYWEDSQKYDITFTAAVKTPDIKNVIIENLLKGKTSDEVLNIVFEKMKDNSIPTIERVYHFDGDCDKNENIYGVYVDGGLGAPNMHDILVANSIVDKDFFTLPKFYTETISKTSLSESEFLNISKILIGKAEDALVKHGAKPKTVVYRNNADFDELEFDNEYAKVDTKISRAYFSPSVADGKFVENLSLGVTVPYSEFTEDELNNFKFEDSIFVDFFKVFHEGDMPTDFSKTNEKFVKEYNSDDPFSIVVEEGSIELGGISYKLLHEFYFRDNELTYSINLNESHKTYKPKIDLQTQEA